MTADGLASVLSHGIWNLEWYFHTTAIHIPLPGSIQKHMCSQLAEQAEKGSDWENDGEAELRESNGKKKGSLYCLAVKIMEVKQLLYTGTR